MNNFCETLGDTDLVSALSLVTERLETLRLKNVSQKKVTDDLIKLCNLIVSYMNTVI